MSIQAKSVCLKIKQLSKVVTRLVDFTTWKWTDHYATEYTVKQLTDHYLRQPHGGNIVGFRGARMQRGYGSRGMFKSLARIAIPLFKRGTKAVGKRALKDLSTQGRR